MNIYDPTMWVMKITPGEYKDTQKYFENLFVKAGCKNLIGYTKEKGNIEQFRDRWLRMKVGDLIVVLEGFNRAFGVVEITSEPWDTELVNEEEDWFIHRRGVRLVKYFNPHITTTSNTNMNTIIEYSGDGAVDICDEIWSLIKDDYIQLKRSPGIQEKLSILQYKKQIILQGPPGTGKTKLAKELAEALIGTPKLNNESLEINDEDIVEALKGATNLKSVSGYADYEILNVDGSNKIILFRKSTKSEDTVSISFSSIKEFYKNNFWKNQVDNQKDRMAASLAKHIFSHKSTTLRPDASNQYKLVQFHPSYGYEDFVRGIVAESKGDSIEYKNVNKILGTLAEEATKNWMDSRKDVGDISKENKTQQYFEQFADDLRERIIDGEKIALTPSVDLVDVEEDAFRYKGKNGWATLGNRMLFKSIIQAFLDGNQVRQDIKKNKNLSGLAIQHASYFVRVLNMFKAYVASNKLTFDHLDSPKVSLQNYVLLIDEINRANLSSVLGELIYALEYRGEKVDSMYAVDGKTELVLPPNLYIIGTMNTADRSVGHIDYAIRRRFAFVDVPPKDLSAELGDKFHKPLFDAVAALFDPKNQHLSPEFDQKDVQLGHSYFIDKSEEGGSMAVRLQYEIKPILREYVKDGILIGEGIEDTIEALRV